jgi:hypothetical protein
MLKETSSVMMNAKKTNLVSSADEENNDEEDFVANANFLGDDDC